TVLSAGTAAGKALPITTAQFIIGRDPGCNLRPASAMISKRHCAVLVKGGSVYLRDFDSTNGTFLNDEAVKGEIQLKDGDLLKVGPLSFKVQIEGLPEPSKPTPPPKPKSAELTDEDAAAALLSIDEDGVSVASSEGGEDQVPGGSTVMEIPAFDGSGETPKNAAVKPAADDKKKKQPAAGAAQDAAKAILDKIRQGKRK